MAAPRASIAVSVTRAGLTARDGLRADPRVRGPVVAVA